MLFGGKNLISYLSKYGSFSLSDPPAVYVFLRLSNILKAFFGVIHHSTIVCIHL